MEAGHELRRRLEGFIADSDRLLGHGWPELPPGGWRDLLTLSLPFSLEFLVGSFPTMGKAHLGMNHILD